MGYGDPHYYDFNGNHFDHQGNCTYVLARDTSQNPPLYSVYINNVPCVDFPGTTCPKELIVEALGHRIYMLPNFTENYEPHVRVDGKVKIPPLEAEDFSIISGGLFTVVYFPLIELEVRFVPVDFHYFRVVVPGKFRGYTEGLCGNCGVNDTTCEVDDTCCDWIHPPEDKARCCGGEAPPPCVPDEEQREWCTNILQPIFEECWEFVDPNPYIENCLTDTCISSNMTCWGFEQYVEECSYHGVCVDWRNDTFCRE
ncbi:putative mucin-2 [Apostichopus japonicus]|uniref:Putative mucin-2 n=1 Tax=Stichopus japonicus TaxID=307972 RepID=A0A2G8K5Y3_STIJA|nr:putative mucin-2 [Apostichopus japonicus]